MFAAFSLGLLGSLHCVAMCGPLTLMLPDGNINLKFIVGRLTYNFGRIITYILLGATAGFFGEKLIFFISQKYLSIGIGLGILLFLFFPILPNSSNLISSNISPLKTFFARLFKKKTLWAQLTFGLLNGLLPCGLIYAALAGAFLMTNWQDAAIYMALFGLGTLPLMFSASLGFGKTKQLLGKHYKKNHHIYLCSLGLLDDIQRPNL